MRNIASAIYFLGMVLLTIPANGQSLAAHVNTSTNGSVWTYTIFNDEVPNSTNYIDSFTLVIGGYQSAQFPV